MGDGLNNVELAEVYRTYGHLLLRRCRIILRDDALGDDALQEVFIKIMRYGGQLRQADSKIRWLYRVVDRCCFDILAKRKRRTDDVELKYEPPSDHPVINLEHRNSAMALLEHLSKEEQMLAVMTYVDGMSQGEVAKVMDWSRQTVNKRLQKIKERANRLGRAL